MSKGKVARIILLALVAGVLAPGATRPVEAQVPEASPWDPSPLQPFNALTAANAPELRILMLSTGISPAALPRDMSARRLEHYDQWAGLDRVGWGTAAASVMSAVYPHTKIAVDSVQIVWSADGCMMENYDGSVGERTWEALGGGGKYHWALKGKGPEYFAANYDAVLFAAPAWCIPPLPASMNRWGSGDKGHVGNQRVMDEIARKPIHPSNTTKPEWGPAITFDAANVASNFTPAGWGGPTSPQTPYHDVGWDLPRLRGSSQWNHYDRIAKVLKDFHDAGLPVIVPAGDQGWNGNREDRRAWQSLGGIAMLDSVITVGAAANNGLAEDPDQGWLVAPTSSPGPTWGGMNKPDLLAPGFATVMVDTDSWMYQQAKCGGVPTVQTCKQVMKSVLPYVPNDPARSEGLTYVKGFGSSGIAASITAVQAAQIRKRWPGGYGGNAESAEALRSLLQAKSRRLTRPSAQTGFAPAPYEQGSGVLVSAPSPEDVGKTPLLTSPLNLPVANVHCPYTDNCPTPTSIGFHGDGGTPAVVTNTTTHLMAVDLAGWPRNLPYQATGYPDPVTFTVGGCPIGSGCSPGCETTCTMTAQIDSPVGYGGLDCGWVVVTSTEGAASNTPYCSARGFSVDFGMYFPWNRPLDGNLVQLNVFNPGYLYVVPPFQMFPVADPSQGAISGMIPSTIPPAITVYESQTGLDGNTTIHNVVPGIYDYRPFGGYEIPASIGTSTTAEPSYGDRDLGSSANFQHTPPLVVPSAIPCSELHGSDHAEHMPMPHDMSADGLMPACRPDEKDWHVKATRQDPNRPYVHTATVTSTYFDDDTGVCLLPLRDIIDEFHEQHDHPLPEPIRTQSREHPYPQAIGFVCGPVRTRFGTGVTSHRTYTIRSGEHVASSDGRGKYEYTAVSGGTTKTFSDVSTRECVLEMTHALPNEGTKEWLMSLDTIETTCTDQVNANRWRFDNMNNHTSILAAAATTLTTATVIDKGTLVGTKDVAHIPIVALNHDFGIFTPNYSTRVTLDLGVDVKNAFVMAIVTAGDSPRYAMIADANNAAVSQTAGTFDPEWNRCEVAPLRSCPIRRSATWDFRSLGVSQGNLKIIIIPTDLEGASSVELSDMELTVETMDKVPFTRGPRDPVEPNEFVIAMNTNLKEQETAKFGGCAGCEPKIPFCNAANVCDDMRVAFGTPKGPTWVTTTFSVTETDGTTSEVDYRSLGCSRDDILLGVGSMSSAGLTDKIKTTVWDPDPYALKARTKIQSVGLPGSSTLVNGVPKLVSKKPQSVNNHFIGVAEVPFDEILNRPSFTAVFGSMGQGCVPPAPPTESPSPTQPAFPAKCMEAIDAWRKGTGPFPAPQASFLESPRPPYAVGSPKYCPFYRVDPGSMVLEGYWQTWKLYQWVGKQEVAGVPVSTKRCWAFTLGMFGPFWDTYSYRQMQSSC